MLLTNCFYFFHFSVFMSGIQSVRLVLGGNDIIIAGYQSTSKSSGMMGINAELGTQMWKLSLFATPTKHDCNLVKSLMKCNCFCHCKIRKKVSNYVDLIINMD